jgi:hypothetical protein
MCKLAVIAGTIGLATVSALVWHARAEDGVPSNTPPVTTDPGQGTPSIKYQMFLDDGTPVRPPTGAKLKEAGKPDIKDKSAGKGKIDQSKTQPPNLLATPNTDRNLAPHAPSDEDERYRVRVRFPSLTPESSSNFQRVGEPNSKGKSAVKIDQSKIQPPNLLANPGSKPKLEPGQRTGGGDGRANFHDVDLQRAVEAAGNIARGAHEKGGQTSKQGGDDAELNAAACKAAAAAKRPLPSFCKPRPLAIDRTFLDRLEAERVEQFRSGPGGFNPNKP